MSEHTKGPWRNDGVVIKSDGAIVAQALKESDARRIVACVNACEGIGTEVLELGRMSSDAFRENESRADRAEKQRDQLLAALKRLSDAALSRDITMGDACNLIAVKEELAAANRQAIAVIFNVTAEGVRNEPV